MTAGRRSGRRLVAFVNDTTPKKLYSSLEISTRPAGGSAFSPRKKKAERGRGSLPPKVIPGEAKLAMNAAGDLAVRPGPARTRDPAQSTRWPASSKPSVAPGGGSFSTPEHVSPPIKPPIEKEEEGKKTIIDLNASEPSAAIDPAGDDVVVWRYYHGNKISVVEAASRPAEGAPSRHLSRSSPGDDSASPEVAIDASGDVTAVWLSSHGATDTIVKSAATPRRRDSHLPITSSQKTERRPSPLPRLR